MLIWGRSVSEYAYPADMKSVDPMTHSQYAFFLLSSASSLKAELDYLCMTLGKRALKLQSEYKIDLHLQQEENKDLIEDELQTELITKLCTHEIMYWHTLLVTTINVSSSSVTAMTSSVPALLRAISSVELPSAHKTTAVTPDTSTSL